MRTASLLSGHGWRSVSTALAAVVPVVLVSLYIAAEPAPWNGPLGPNYPGAAALASAVTKVKPEPVAARADARSRCPRTGSRAAWLGEAAATPKECVYGDTSHPVLTVALVGDSIAGDWFTPLQKIAVERHWKLVTELHSICPLTSALMITPTIGRPVHGLPHLGNRGDARPGNQIRPDVVITSELSRPGHGQAPGGRGGGAGGHRGRDGRVLGPACGSTASP